MTQYAIRQSIRNNNEVKNSELIKQIADLVDPRHKVNLSSPDKVILVDVFQVCAHHEISATDTDANRVWMN